MIRKDGEKFKECIIPAFAEMTAMFLFIYISVGTAISSVSPLDIRIPLAFGTTIFVLAFSIGKISGGHINPAVTASLFAIGDISLMRALMYIVAQLLGAILSAIFLGVTFESESYGITEFNNISEIRAFIIEAIMTFALLFTVSASTDTDNKSVIPHAIGMAVFICHLIGVPMTGCGINPARSLGSCVAAQIWGKPDWTHHWLYWVAPLTGGIVASVLYKCIFIAKKHMYEKPEDQKCSC